MTARTLPRRISDGITTATAASAYLNVNNGGSLERLAAAALAFSSESLAAGSTLTLTKNSFGGTLYCTLPYVSQLMNNTSFGIVDVSGGTLSQNLD